MKMCDFLRISQDYGIWHAFLRLKRWAIVTRSLRDKALAESPKGIRAKD